jgi:homoserine O-acetyltransferase
VTARGRPVLALLAAGLAAAAVAPRAVAQGDTGTYVVHDFRFADGETLPALRLHYMTMGHPARGDDGLVRNGVLILHGTTGSGRQFLNPLFAGELFSAGQPLDTATHYLIFPDGIGHGRSSRPSDGLHARFPHYTYDDMVDAQYRLLTERLGVYHLLLVMGTSMGGMQTWVWGERYPDFMDGLVPLASLPAQIAGRNRMMRKLIMDDIRDDPAWRGGDYAAQPPGLRAALQLLWVMTTSPLVLRRAAPIRDSADAYITRWLNRAARSYDANDVWYAFDASRDYDPSPGLERITAPLLAINSADDYVNPPELGIMEHLIRRVRRGRFVLIPISDVTRGHGTHTVAAAWKAEFGPFVAGLERRSVAP